MLQLAPGHPREVLHELPWLVGSMAGLAAMLILEHFLVYKQIVLPALEITAEPPLWMWGAMFVPELVAFFAAGWRLRSWVVVAAYAAIGATVREGIQYLLSRAGEPGYGSSFVDPFSDFAVHWPPIALAYACVLGLAAWSGRQEGRLLAGA